jgi:hypothetical protein
MLSTRDGGGASGVQTGLAVGTSCGIDISDGSRSGYYPFEG